MKIEDKLEEIVDDLAQNLFNFKSIFGITRLTVPLLQFL